MIYPLFAAAAFLAAVWFTRSTYRRIGYREGLRAAGRLHRSQLHIEHVRGRCDGIRRVTRWLRDHGHHHAADQLPTLHIEP